jgi:predicted AAA+ superfamily ATPase
LYFWRIQGRYEVDFIIEAGKDIIAVEVKAATRWDSGDLAGLNAFLKAEPRCKVGLLAYNGTEMARLGDKLWAVPLDTLLS